MNMKYLSLVFVLILICFGTTAKAETVTLTTGEWPPFMSEEFKHGGMGTRIATEAFARAGIAVKYEYLPWKRAYDVARHGEVTGSLAWRKTPAREELFHFSEPLFSEKTVFFHKKSLDFDWKTLKDIGRHVVGLTLGYATTDQILPVVEMYGGRADIAPSDESNFQKLVNGRIQVFPCSEEVGYYLLKSKFPPGATDMITNHPKVFIQSPLYLVIGKSIPGGRQIMDRFDKGIIEMREEGLLEKYRQDSIAGKYLPAYASDWKNLQN